MDRRTLLRRSCLGLATVGTVGLAGCSSESGGEGGDPSEPLPELALTGQTLNSTIDELTIAGYQNGLRRGRQHEDIHFAVTLSITNEGDQRVDLADYGYDLTLFDETDTDITPGDTWASNADTVGPGETGQVLVQVSFLDSPANPEQVRRYRLVLGCGQGASAYC